MIYRHFVVGVPLDRPAYIVLSNLVGLDGLADLDFSTLRTEGRMGYIEGLCPESDWGELDDFCVESFLEMDDAPSVHVRGTADGHVAARVHRERVTADGEWCWVDLGKPEEALRLVLAALSHPGDVAHMEGNE